MRQFTVHFIFYIYIGQCTVNWEKYTEYSVKCCVHFMLHSLHREIYSTVCTVYNSQFILQCVQYNLQCSMHTIQSPGLSRLHLRPANWLECQHDTPECNAVHCTALHCTILLFNAMHCTALYFNAVQWSLCQMYHYLLNFTYYDPLYYPTLHWTNILWSVLHGHFLTFIKLISSSCLTTTKYFVQYFSPHFTFIPTSSFSSALFWHTKKWFWYLTINVEWSICISSQYNKTMS